MDNYEKIFADKLRSLRKQRGLRQNDVANAVGYSEKSVSKWESGKVLPPVNALLALCDVFGVELADLLDIKHETSYFLGIDGGATKTDFVLANANGDIIRKKRLGSTNAFDIGLNAAKALLTEGINDICRGISIRKISMYAGLSGGTSGNMRQIFGEFFNSFGFNKALSGSDANNILSAGLGNRDGVALIMGTGSSAFIQKDGKVYRAGGLGYLFDGGGSGYDIGRSAIKYACMQEDLTGGQTIINDLLRQKIHRDTVSGSLDYFYSCGKAAIASFAPIVFEAYDKGDAVARQILCDVTEQIALLLSAAYKRIKSDFIEVVAVGGLTNRMDALYPFIKKHLEKLSLPCEFDIKVYNGSAVYGALLLAGMPPKSDFLQIFNS